LKYNIRRKEENIMDENQKEEQNINTEEIKKETVETVNQVKETIKNVDIKNDAKVAKGFIGSMFKDPFGTIKKIVNDNKNSHFKTAIIFVVIWTIVLFINALSVKYWSFDALFRNILSLIKTIIAPALGIFVMSLIIYCINKENKKSLVTVMTAVVTAKIPVIIAAVVSLLTIIDTKVALITSPFTSLCNVISTVLIYFTAKAICGEEQNSKFFSKFVIIETIFYVAYLIISLLGIYIK
jgi:hypothetical protein